MTRQKQRTTEDQQRWQAEQAARTTALMEQLEAGIQALQTSADFKRYLAAAARFHSYSYANVLLVLAQKPSAIRVAGYRTWQRLGRQVRKGERAIYIFAPRPYRVTTATAAGEEETREGLTFRLVPVWDQAQTDGDPLPAMDAPALTGDADTATYDALVRFATHEDLTITNDDPNTDGDDSCSRYHGYYSPGRKLIFVKRAAPAQMLKTLIHELAHHLDSELRSAPQPERETVAEATAFVVAAHRDIDTGSYSFPYVAAWAGQDDGVTLLKAVMARVQHIAHQMIDALDGGSRDDADDPGQEPPAPPALAA